MSKHARRQTSSFRRRRLSKRRRGTMFPSATVSRSSHTSQSATRFGSRHPLHHRFRPCEESTYTFNSTSTSLTGPVNQTNGGGRQALLQIDLCDISTLENIRQLAMTALYTNPVTAAPNLVLTPSNLLSAQNNHIAVTRLGVRHEILNCTSATIRVVAYDIIARKSLQSGTVEETSRTTINSCYDLWAQGLAANFASQAAVGASATGLVMPLNPLTGNITTPSFGAAINTGSTGTLLSNNSVDAPCVLGAKPFTSRDFCTAYKVIKTTSFELESYCTHLHTYEGGCNYQLSAEALNELDQNDTKIVENFSRTTLFVVMGTSVFDQNDSIWTTSPPGIAVISNFYVGWKYGTSKNTTYQFDNMFHDEQAVDDDIVPDPDGENPIPMQVMGGT